MTRLPSLEVDPATAGQVKEFTPGVPQGALLTLQTYLFSAYILINVLCQGRMPSCLTPHCFHFAICIFMSTYICIFSQPKTQFEINLRHEDAAKKI